MLINGPNLGRLGKRKPEIYGSITLSQVETEVNDLLQDSGCLLLSKQSNHEGEIIDFLESNREKASALIINPGALMINGWSLRDSLEDFPAPWLEVHISNILGRESFRHHSIISDLSSGLIFGFGTSVYLLATYAILRILGIKPPATDDKAL